MQEEEIDLRSYISIILKRWKLIFAIFFVTSATTAVVTLLMPEVYEATTSIMITPSKLRTSLSPTSISLDVETERGKNGLRVGPQPVISVETHKSLLESNKVLGKLIDELELKDKMGVKLSPDILSKSLEVSEVKRTSLIQLRARHADPEMAKEIVNTWASIYLEFSKSLISGEVKGSGEFVTSQFETARKLLIQTERERKNFDLEENLSILQMELDAKKNELDSTSESIYKLEFQLAEKKKNLEKIEGDISAMEKDGNWIGLFDPELLAEEDLGDKNLSSQQQFLHSKSIEVARDFKSVKKERENFINNSRIELLRGEIQKKREVLLADKSTLAEIHRLSRTTEANLNSGGGIRGIGGPLAQNLSDSTVWEILSLKEKRNFFKTHAEFLEMKIEKEEKGLKLMEKTLFDYETQLRTLDKKLSYSEANYDFYLNKFDFLGKTKNSLQSEIDNLEFQLSRSKAKKKQLTSEVKKLEAVVNSKSLRLADLDREMAIRKNAYLKLTDRLAETQIARAVALGEIKIVSPAVASKYRIKPKRKKMVGISGAVSLFLGCFVAFFLEFLQPVQK